jgi:hypothetical protein
MAQVDAGQSLDLKRHLSATAKAHGAACLLLLLLLRPPPPPGNPLVACKLNVESFSELAYGWANGARRPHQVEASALVGHTIHLQNLRGKRTPVRDAGSLRAALRRLCDGTLERLTVWL